MDDYFKKEVCFDLLIILKIKVTKSSHHLSHDRASKGHGSIPEFTSQTDLHYIKSL